ncbi:hypothetical protein K438DRAFT_1774184 [Mycena galopus ATCC 62051]|nr:hypothetical protein K438DRAFT_1774184 [Mycena galopus ATCC 62051]
MSERERKSRESPLPEVEISSFEAKEVEGKLGTVRKPLKTWTRVAKEEPSSASPNLVKNKGMNWNKRVAVHVKGLLLRALRGITIHYLRTKVLIMMLTKVSVLFGMVMLAAFVSANPLTCTSQLELSRSMSDGPHRDFQANLVPDSDRVITASAPKTGRSPVPASPALHLAEGLTQN